MNKIIKKVKMEDSHSGNMFERTFCKILVLKKYLCSKKFYLLTDTMRSCSYTCKLNNLFNNW